MTEFVNPYNFIPFDATGPARPDSETAEEYRTPSRLLSGWMDVLLTPKTPLIIPDGRPMDGKGPDAGPLPERDNQTHRYYRFYRLPDGRPAIPGSSIRGMIRSVYEAASNSCLPFLLNDEEITLRTPSYASFRERGLLSFDRQAGAWKLYEAVDYVIDDPIYTNDTRANVPENQRLRNVLRNGFYCAGNGRQTRYSCGQRVAFIPDEYTARLVDDETPNAVEGWLQFNRPVGLSWRLLPGRNRYPAYHVHVLTKGDEIEFDDRSRERLDLYGDYRAVLMSTKTDEAKSLLDKLKEVRRTGEGCVPVWYQMVTREEKNEKLKLIYLSAGSISRVHQKRRWADVMGAYVPCDDPDCLCPACQLFGTVNAGGKRGRVRFGDALPAGACEEPIWITLPILSSPKPTAFEFYLKRPVNGATYWNYDYYSTGNQNNAVYHDLSSATPRGRKLYWHGRPQALPDRDSSRTNQNVTVQALRPVERNRFRFRLYFDGITKAQLEQLKWVITLGENNPDGALWHKLGHGRPVGYGSAKLTLEEVCLRSVENGAEGFRWALDRQTTTGKAIACPWQPEGMKAPERVTALLAMSNSGNTLGEIVNYPLQEKRGSIAIFNWFADNRMNSDRLKTLPEVSNVRRTLVSNVPESAFTALYEGAAGASPQQGPTPRQAGPMPRSAATTAPNSAPGRRYADRGGNRPQGTPSAGRPGELVGKVVEGRIKGFHKNGSVYVFLTDRIVGFMQYRGGMRYDEQFKPDDTIQVRVVRYDEGFNQYKLELVKR